MPSLRRPDNNDHWEETHGGLRGSTVLAAGTLLAAIAALTNLAGGLVALADDPVRPAVVMTAWLAWILAMAISGLGFFLIGCGPVLSRLGVVLGTVHFGYAVLLLVTIFTNAGQPAPLSAVSLGRCILLATFAMQEKLWLGRKAVALLAGAASLQGLKISLRVTGALSGLDAPLLQVIDVVIGVALALAILQTALVTRRHEAQWASNLAGPRATIEIFDNPDHDDPRAR